MNLLSQLPDLKRHLGKKYLPEVDILEVLVNLKMTELGVLATLQDRTDDWALSLITDISNTLIGTERGKDLIP
jgi:hypothetical protein